MSHKTRNAQFHTTFFCRSVVLSLPAVLLRKVSISGQNGVLYEKKKVMLVPLTVNKVPQNQKLKKIIV